MLGSLVVVEVKEGRRKSCIVADPFCVVRRVESSAGYAFRVVADGAEFTEGTNNVFAVVHFDHSVVVLVADQRVTVLQADSAGGQRASASRQSAARASASKVLPHHVLTSVDLHNSRVVRICDECVTIFEPAGESNTTDWIVDIWVTTSVLPDNVAAGWQGALNFEGAVVVFVTDENVAVLQQFGASGWPPGVPVPAIRVSSPMRWASLVPMIDADEKSDGPRPNCQTILPL